MAEIQLILVELKNNLSLQTFCTIENVVGLTVSTVSRPSLSIVTGLEGGTQNKKAFNGGVRAVQVVYEGNKDT